jgi:hypothetical protein
MNNDLGKVSLTSSLVKDDTVLVEQGGSIKRITFDNLIGSINSGDEQVLRQVAWGVPLEKSSNPAWGVVGNTALRDEWNEMKGRYLVTNAGLAAKLSKTNSNVYADGTTLDVSKGHIMVVKPRLYYLFKKDSYTGYNMLWMSTLPIGGHYIEQICDGAFLAYVRSGALTSIPSVVPTRSLTITQFWNYAQVNGKDWGLIDWDSVRYYMMECLSDYGSPNIQTNLGYGVGGSAGNSLWNGGFSTGETMSLGDESGYVTISGDSNHTSLHGSEDLYNAEWQMVQGIYFGSSSNSAQSGTEAFIYQGNRLPSSTELTTQPSGEYRQSTRYTAGSNYVSSMKLGEYFDLLATGVSGSSSTYWCDYYYGNSTGQLCLWGADAGNGSPAGLAYVSSHGAFGHSSAGIGSRLAYKGKLTFVDGRQIA